MGHFGLQEVNASERHGVDEDWDVVRFCNVNVSFYGLPFRFAARRATSGLVFARLFNVQVGIVPRSRLAR